MGKLFIVEGPDGAGKTTLIKQLVDVLSGPTKVVHHGPYLDLTPLQLFKTYYDSFVQDMDSGTTNVILDRSWISEIFYGNQVRGKSRIAKFINTLLNNQVYRLEGSFIYCMPPIETCVANYASRKELEYLEDESALRAVYGVYNSYIMNDMSKKFIHDYTTTSFEELLFIMQSVKCLTKKDLKGDLDEVT